MTPNAIRFRDALVAQYLDLFANDSDYSYIAAYTTPEALADDVVKSLMRCRANKDSKAIKGVCKLLGVRLANEGIKAYLMAE